METKEIPKQTSVLVQELVNNVVEAKNKDSDLLEFRKKTPEYIFRDISKNSLEALADIPEEKVVEAIYKNPPIVITSDGRTLKPTIDIKNPTEEEMATTNLPFAKREDYPDINDKDFELIQYTEQRLRDYISRPRVDDGFVDHKNERKIWEAGILNALKMLDYYKTNADNQTPYSTAFNQKWTNNKYATNSLTETFSLIDIIETSIFEYSENSKFAKEGLSTIRDEFGKVGITSGGSDPATRSGKSIDEVVDGTSEIVRKTIKLFANPPQSEEELENILNP